MFVIASVEIWASVPAGLALSVAPVATWAVTIAGALVGVVVVATAGDAIRTRLVARFGHVERLSHGRLFGIWVRYGVPGWGLVSPLVFAPPMGTALALALGAPRGRLVAWMAIGVVVWTTLLVTVAVLGLGILRTIH